jgi:hypothetical protein
MKNSVLLTSMGMGRFAPLSYEEKIKIKGIDIHQYECQYIHTA